MTADLENWALPRLARLLPLDDVSLREILTYTSTLPKDAGAEHLKNLLGDSTQAFEFIASFNSRRGDASETGTHERRVHSDSLEAVPRYKKKQPKQHVPLHVAGPVRKPEGYGDITGGYNKQKYEQDLGRGHRRDLSATSVADALALSQKPEALQLPKVVNTMDSPSAGQSRDVSPAGKSSPRLPPSAAGSLISDMPNVKSKQAKKSFYSSSSQPHSGIASPHGKASTMTTSSIADLTSAIAALEVATNPSVSSQRRKCECNASIHPLFTTAPNCLKCGKIICALEGLQPCSFCDTPILTKDQVNSMIKALKEERGIERMSNHNAGVALSGRGTPMLSTTPESSSGDESSTAAARARAHRDRLLAFQRDNAQRTKVHDEAADYDMTLTPGATQWMSPVQRATALKKQQQYLRELQEANRPEWEKKRTVMSMSIKNGKLVKTYGREQVPSTTVVSHLEQEDETEETMKSTDEISNQPKGAFSRNPLLRGGGLIRPVWHTSDEHGEQETKSSRSRQSIWRRVQDDDDDNEQWILDGGLRGYGTETRLMEDGSQQECG